MKRPIAIKRIVARVIMGRVIVERIVMGRWVTSVFHILRFGWLLLDLVSNEVSLLELGELCFSIMFLTNWMGEIR